MEDTGVTLGLGRLRGKSAVVTGAAKGIGRATAELFAREGALLVLTDVDEAGLEELGERLAGRDAEVETVVGDVSVPKDAKRMIEAAVERFGRIDILVANAGVIPLNTIVDATPEDWDYVMSVDGRGMFLTCKYARWRMQSCSSPPMRHLL
jgi:NAD(P)-dependent dehydrogenase (short-subunit alcohol dehydrogenase family)